MFSNTQRKVVLIHSNCFNHDYFLNLKIIIIIYMFRFNGYSCHLCEYWKIGTFQWRSCDKCNTMFWSCFMLVYVCHEGEIFALVCLYIDRQAIRRLFYISAFYKSLGFHSVFHVTLLLDLVRGQRSICLLLFQRLMFNRSICWF